MIKAVFRKILVSVFALALLFEVVVKCSQIKAENHAVSSFIDNKVFFYDTVDSHSANKSETANIFRPVQHISVPEQLSAIGVKDIYSVNDIIYFEYTGSIMGVIGYGVLYVEDYSKISEWYYVKLIEENWYYYNVE